MTPTAAQLPVHLSYHADRCKNCHQPAHRDYLNSYGECYDCAARAFADYLDDHPHARRAEIVAEGRRSGLSHAHINLVMSVHRINWQGQ